MDFLHSQIYIQEKPAEEREVETEADPDLIETAGVFSEESLVNVRKEVELNNFKSFGC